jgi:3-methyladenine DNA glycosylase AlkD
MMTAEEIVKQLEDLGNDQIKRILMKHGAKEPILGVKIEELQKIRKVVKKDHDLALALFDTGIYDAQYLAGLIADEKRMTADLLRHWLATSNSGPIRGVTVAWVAAESSHGYHLAREWIGSPDEERAATGWNVLNCWIAVRPDTELDLPELERLMHHVEKVIHSERNRVRYAMTNYVISAGIYLASLTDKAVAAGERIGKVTVDMGDTDCQVPLIAPYIGKAQARGAIGKKRKTVRC